MKVIPLVVCTLLDIYVFILYIRFDYRFNLVVQRKSQLFSLVVEMFKHIHFVE
jgi:hypothetical protein